MDSEPQPIPAKKPAARATPAAKPPARTKPAVRSVAQEAQKTESAAAPVKKAAAPKRPVTPRAPSARATPAAKKPAPTAKKPAPTTKRTSAAAEKLVQEKSVSEKPTTDAVAAQSAPATVSPATTNSAPSVAKDAPVRSTPRKPAVAKKNGAAPSPRAAAAKRPSTTPKLTAAAKKESVAVVRDEREIVLTISGLTKSFDETLAVDNVSLEVRVGSFFGVVGPNGAGKTTTLSMVTGLLRPDAGTITVHGADVWSDPVAAKRNMGVLPDRLRLFDRLSGAQFLYYSATLRGLDGPTARKRLADLAFAFGLEDSLNRLVTDYSAGMTKKIALAAAMIHSPRLLVLDEPFESVDPVSAANITEILKQYAKAGGTVVLSSHSMDLVQRICDDVAVVVGGAVLASGTMAQVRGGKTLEERFVELAGGRTAAEGLEWLHSFSD